MNQITPTIRLLTGKESQDSGLQIKTLILEHNGNNYHLHGGTGDTIYTFTQGLGIYVLTINKALCYIGFNAYMTPEPDPINIFVLHDTKLIREYLGNKWESMKPAAIIIKLMEYLC
jgi:hypothetical protein